MPRASVALPATGRSLAGPAGIDPAAVRGPVVYLIHLARPYRHAQHYIGYTSNLASRVRAHRSGAGTPLLAAASAAGIPFAVVRVWPGEGRAFERRLHRGKHGGRICPSCNGDLASAYDRTPFDA